MKIAVINHRASTGGWAYITNLILAMKKLDPSLIVEVFSSLKFASKTKAQEYLKELRNAGVNINDIGIFPKWVMKEKTHFHILNCLANFVRMLIFKTKCLIHNVVYKNLSCVDADVIFYSWPYEIEPLSHSDEIKAMVNKKVFFIPHDFIYTHCFFTSGGYSFAEVQGIYNQHKAFLNAGIPIVSTDFVAKELKNTFPEISNNAKVIYLAALNNLRKKKYNDISIVLKKYNIRGEYVISANNWEPHKNLGQIVSAMYLVRKKYPNLKLVLTGYGTANMSSDLHCSLYGNWLNISEDPCVLGLGIVDKEDFSSLLQGAKLAITTSLCEAGSGMALDAWSVGTPMVMSDIESFRNQVDFLGTKAEFCNPRNNEDIAKAILKLLDNPDIAQNYVETSEKAMKEYTWDNVAEQYLKIFRGNE